MLANKICTQIEVDEKENPTKASGFPFILQG